MPVTKEMAVDCHLKQRKVGVTADVPVNVEFFTSVKPESYPEV